MTRGVERLETELVLVEFEGGVLTRQVFFGFIKYLVREFVPKPMRCYNCQQFGHMAMTCKKELCKVWKRA